MLSPNDEFADYETWDKANLNGTEAKTDDMLQFEYAREALKNGLLLEEKLGVNPFKFGMVGSDRQSYGLARRPRRRTSSASTPAWSPSRIDGSTSSSRRRTRSFTIMGWQQAASGFAAVWADREHARGHLRRHEAQGDLRDDGHAHDLVVRFFGGWDFTEADAQTRLPARAGYAKGSAHGRRPAGPRAATARRPSWSPR